MATLRFRLFGRFSIQRDDELIKGFDAGKDQELLSYLLIRRDRSHPRETLASLLWGDTSTEKSKKYLRQALWHLHAALETGEPACPQALLVGHDWIQVNLVSGIWLDVASFEEAFAIAKGTPGKQLDASSAELLKEAVRLYRGDLLEGCYQDWCLFERERLQNIYLSMLEKLLLYSKEHREYETGQSYASLILQYDRARESTHRQLMQLQFEAGDRTAALRQYERCVRALDEELGVKPQKSTTTLYDQIRADRLEETSASRGHANPLPAASLPDVLSRLKQLQLVLAAVQRRIQRDVKAVEKGLGMTGD